MNRDDTGRTNRFRAAHAMLLATAATIGTASAATAAQAQEAAANGRHRFDIPAQDATAALQSYAKQSGRQVLFSYDAVKGRATQAVSGELTDDAALQRLLKGSGLTITSSDGATVTLAPAGPPAAGGGSVSSMGEDSPVAGEAASFSGDGNAVSEIVVTGSNIRGVTDIAAPTITINRRQIEDQGFRSVEDIARSLPQNFAAASPESSRGGGASATGVARQSIYTTSLDLRGLGPTATLVLIGGHRTAGNVQGRAVDVSTLPLPLVDRVEIVSGGRSAIYGADAVGGVANFVLRRSFSGAQTDVSFGRAERGGDRLQFTQTAGLRGNGGGLIISYDFTREKPVDLIGSRLIQNPSPDGSIVDTFNLNADTKRHTVYGAGHVKLAEGIEAYADGTYNWTDFDDPSTLRIPSFDYVSRSNQTNKIRQLGVGGGFRFDLGLNRQLDVSAYTSRLSNTVNGEFSYSIGETSSDTSSFSQDVSRVTTISAIIDGPVLRVLGMEVRGAFGAEYRRESLDQATTAFGMLPQGSTREIRSLSGELQVPIVAEGTNSTKSLTLSLASRYDEYSDFGSTLNPQLGLIWESDFGVRVRGSYSTAYKAPDLYSLGFQSGAYLYPIDLCNSVGTCENRPVLMRSGGNPNLRPEKAKSWTMGVDYHPGFAPWLKIGFSYLSIDFRGRIETPSAELGSLLPTNLDLYPGLSNLAPNVSEIASVLSAVTDGTGSAYNYFGLPWVPDPASPDQGLLAALPNLAIFDNRLNNVANQKLDAIDLSADASRDTDVGRLSLGINATYTLRNEQQTTSASPYFSTINRVGRPADFRFRAVFGIERAQLSANVSMDYLGGYPNTLSPGDRLDSWTRLNASFILRTGEQGRLFRNFTAALSITNLFDSRPPLLLNPNNGLRYDPANATGVGRYISVKISKKW